MLRTIGKQKTDRRKNTAIILSPAQRAVCISDNRPHQVEQFKSLTLPPGVCSSPPRLILVQRNVVCTGKQRSYMHNNAPRLQKLTRGYTPIFKKSKGSEHLRAQRAVVRRPWATILCARKYKYIWQAVLLANETTHIKIQFNKKKRRVKSATLNYLAFSYEQPWGSTAYAAWTSFRKPSAQSNANSTIEFLPTGSCHMYTHSQG